MSDQLYTCACCGYRTLDETPGSFDICPICFWEDDPVQLLNPAYRGGANSPSLLDAQQNFQRLGAIEERFQANVRKPIPADVRDPLWRPATPKDAECTKTPSQLSATEYADLTTWYYWLRNAG